MTAFFFSIFNFQYSIFNPHPAPNTKHYPFHKLIDIIPSWKKKEKLLIKKHKNTLNSCEKKLGISFRKKLFLLEAITHKSYACLPDNDANFYNERLEFLGDSILGMIITEHLFRKHPDKNEGVLTEIKSKLIRKETLAELAQAASLGEFILFGENEVKMGSRQNTSILSNTLESLIGAYFLDCGFKKTKSYILSLFKELLNKEFHDLPVFEYKNKLQEYTQSIHGKSPVYRIISSQGPEHEKIFTAEVYLENNVLGQGTGKSKKEAETKAAEAALKKLGREIN